MAEVFLEVKGAGKKRPSCAGAKEAKRNLNPSVALEALGAVTAAATLPKKV
jgi:hypothetical protein